MKQHIIDQRVQMGGITNSADQAVKASLKLTLTHADCFLGQQGRQPWRAGQQRRGGGESSSPE
jgi:hypothetical protein